MNTLAEAWGWYLATKRSLVVCSALPKNIGPTLRWRARQYGMTTISECLLPTK